MPYSYHTTPGVTYAVECAGEVTVTNEQTGAVAVTGDGSASVYFTATDNLYVISDDTAKVQPLFKLAPRLKLALLQGGAGGWLPKGFTELEYLESPATPDNLVVAYFALPLPNVTSPNDSIAYETEHMFMPNGSIVQGEGSLGNYTVWAIGNHGKLGTFVAVDGVLNNPSALGQASIDWNITFTCSYEEWHRVRHSIGSAEDPQWRLSVDGAQVIDTALKWGTGLPARTYFYLFGAPQLTTAARALCGKKRSAKIWVNGQLLYDLVPVLDDTGTPGFYDRKNGEMYYNAGAGDFLYPSPVATFSLRRVAYVPEFAQLTPRGVRRLYRVPDGYAGSIAEYAAEHGFKRLVESAQPADGYWSPVWQDTETELRLEWQSVPEPQEEEFLTE